jgi:hypothetical protein
VTSTSQAPSRRRFDELASHTGLIPYAELEQFWSSLEPVDIDFMIGEWRGGELPSGHRGEGFLGDRWFGTTFRSATDVDPAVCLDEDGNKYSTATMVYDAMPIHDHFKKVDDNVVVAITNGKGALDGGRYFFFYLERV